MGPPYLIANILKIPWPNCMKIGELLQYYVLNRVINFLFKNFIALWRHLAKTQLLCDAQIYLYNVNKRFRKVAPQRDEIFKQKVNDCVECSAYNIAEVHQFWLWNFQNICNEIWWPHFLRHLVCTQCVKCVKVGVQHTFFQSTMSFSFRNRKIPFPCDLATGFMIQICPGFFLNSSTNMWYSVCKQNHTVMLQQEVAAVDNRNMDTNMLQ